MDTVIIVILFLIGILIITLVVNEIIICSVYGKPISKHVIDEYMNLDISKLRLNMYNSSILQTEKNFITNLPNSILAKYYINNTGIIPRWSKLHKKVEEYFVIAAKNVDSDIKD